MTNGTGTEKAKDPIEDPKKVQTVYITPGARPGDPPRVVPKLITLFEKDSFKNPKQIKWECTDPSAKFEVKFKSESETPFDRLVYNNTYHESSEPRDGCTADKPYKYSVSVNGGTLDPDVIIER